MQILVTNDDGISAPGLWALARAVRPLGVVKVCAPDRDRSGVGPGLTLHQPLQLVPHPSPIEGIPAYAVDGTPGDAAVMGVHQLFDGKPDVVVSGHNSGNNMASDVWLSGTVGAALHGRLNGVNAAAFSVHNIADTDSPLIANLTRAMVEQLSRNGHEDPALLNINFPLVSPNACRASHHVHEPDGARIKGVLRTRLGPPLMGDLLVQDERTNRSYFWNARTPIWRHGDPLDEGTDLHALISQNISITPLDRRLDDSVDHPITGAVIRAAKALLAKG